MEMKKKSISVWVVFTGKTDIGWLKILKKGFRHCFVIFHDGGCWMSIDPLSSYTDIQIYPKINGHFDLPVWFQRRGYHVVRGTINSSHTKAAPWMFFTCVEAVKRILGIHKRWIITPWQLYKFLKTQIHSSHGSLIRKEYLHG